MYVCEECGGKINIKSAKKVKVNRHGFKPAAPCEKCGQLHFLNWNGTSKCFNQKA